MPIVVRPEDINLPKNKLERVYKFGLKEELEEGKQIGLKEGLVKGEQIGKVLFLFALFTSAIGNIVPSATRDKLST